MPLYEYRCQSCDELTEVLQRFDDAPLTTCSECGGELAKQISASAFRFKGSGWYVTDYAKKSEGGTKSEGDGKESAKESAKESTKSDAKSTDSSSSGGASSTDKPAAAT